MSKYEIKQKPVINLDMNLLLLSHSHELSMNLKGFPEILLEANSPYAILDQKE